jgi:hypothetical protein
MFLRLFANQKELGDYSFDKSISIGSSTSCDVCLEGIQPVLLSITYPSLVAEVAGDETVVINGANVTKTTLANGDVLCMGDYKLTFFCTLDTPAQSGHAKTWKVTGAVPEKDSPLDSSHQATIKL